MNRRLLGILLILMAWMASEAGATTRVVASGAFDLKDYRGKVVVLDFWAGWCKPCKEALPWLSELQHKYGPDGLVVVAVNVDRVDAVPGDLIAKLDKDIVVVLDPARKFSRTYHLGGLPMTILLDRQGRIRARHSGFAPEEKAQRTKDLKSLLQEKWQPVESPQ